MAAITAPYSTSSSALMRTIFSFWFSMISLTRVASSPSLTGLALMYSSLFLPMAITVWPCVSGLSTVFAAIGSFTDTPGRGVVLSAFEVSVSAGQVVVNPPRGNRDAQPERGLDERFRDPRRHGPDATRPAGRDALERGDDADHRAEQSDERRRRAD